MSTEDRYDEFRASSIVERRELYRDIAKQVWNLYKLLATAEGGA